MTLQPFVERARRSALVALAATLFTFATAVGQARLRLLEGQVTSVNVEALGPKVGERLPPFSLNDQTGTQRTLQSIAGPKGAIIVFFRSADW
jgi:cytochrome oxidase Cu insertion factor (SCO1/SenC/PrrC family)